MCRQHQQCTLLQPRSENYFKTEGKIRKILQIFREINTLKKIEQKVANFTLLKWLYLKKGQKGMAVGLANEYVSPKE